MNKISAEVVIIGGGVRGLSIAYGLAKVGVDVVLLEKRYIAAGASGLNMGYVNISVKKPTFYTQFSKISADLYPDLNEELGGDIEYERNASLSVAKIEQEWEALSRIVEERNKVSGVGMRMLDIDEMRQMEPNLSPRLLGATKEKAGEDVSVTVNMLSDIARQAMSIIPALQKARAIRFAAGLRPMTPDTRPIYQKIDGVCDFYIAVGHSGITLAPITGKIFSELIPKGETDILINKYKLERFQE
jgi:glycine/D-amino acid oxidase-like deaminating enzyme